VTDTLEQLAENALRPWGGQPDRRGHSGTRICHRDGERGRDGSGARRAEPGQPTRAAKGALRSYRKKATVPRTWQRTRRRIASRAITTTRCSGAEVEELPAGRRHDRQSR